MLNRRTFLQHSSLVSLAPLMPAFLAPSARATEARSDDRILVVVELTGGNDGLNTVIPFGDENYRKYRDKLRIDEKDVFRLTDSLGLHPAMQEAKELFDDGLLAVIPGVGYPNPSRSHFRSQAIWHSARLDAEDHNGQGWLGRACDEDRTPGTVAPDAVFIGDETMPAAIIGRRTHSIALNNENELMLASGLTAPEKPASGDDLSLFVHSTVDASYAAARRFADSGDGKTTGSDGYPDDALARRLRLLSRIIRLGGGTRIFYAQQGGYDTHAGQKPTHNGLLRAWSRSLKAFFDDLKEHDLSDRVTVLTFSEFGRQLRENASVGTDHGTCGPVFVAGEAVKPGILSAYPSLIDLEDNEMKATVDFRSIYSSLLANWLEVDAIGPLGGNFAPLKVIQTS